MTHDPAETDAAALSSSEELDEDELRVDPLEEGMDPPERWSEADHFGTTTSERHEGEPLEQRLAEERPDMGADEPSPRRPTVAATPATQLDESVDEAEDAADSESQAPPETAANTVRQNADQGGGSVADTIRTPEHRPE